MFNENSLIVAKLSFRGNIVGGNHILAIFINVPKGYSSIRSNDN